MINDVNARLSKSIANNDFLGVKVAEELLNCAQKSHEKAKASIENLKKKRDSIGKNWGIAFSNFNMLKYQKTVRLDCCGYSLIYVLFDILTHHGNVVIGRPLNCY